MIIPFLVWDKYYKLSHDIRNNKIVGKLQYIYKCESD